MGEPLQHPPTPFRDRQHRPEHLRNRRIRYPPRSGITQPTPCPRSGVKAHSSATPVLVTNARKLGAVSAASEGTVGIGDPLLRITPVREGASAS